jgi:chromosome segregation ATPase
MARPGVTREQVYGAADALVLEGQAPTVVAVRTKLGGGSPNTITPYLAEWKEAHETKRADTLPPLPEPVEGAMRQVWGSAWKGAQEQLEGEREALVTARKDIEKERAEMLAEISRLDTALEQAQGETRKTAEDLESERRAHDQTKAEVREARAVAAERDKRIEDQTRELAEVRRQLSDASGKASRLEAGVAHARQDLETARASARQEADTRAEAVRERDRALSDNERLLAELEAVRETAKQAKTALDLSGKKVQKLEASIEEEREARAAAERALSELRVEAATLTERAAHVDELRAMLEQLRPATSRGKSPTKKTQPKSDDPEEGEAG